MNIARLFFVAIVAALWSAQAQTIGSVYIKNATSVSVQFSDGTWNAFPGFGIDLNTGKRLVTATTGVNEHSVNSLVAKVSIDSGATWINQVTLRTPPAGYFSGSGDVTWSASLNAFLIAYVEQKDDGSLYNVYVLICTIDGSNIASCPTATLVSIPSGWKWIYFQGKIVVLANGHFMVPFYGQLNSQTGSVTTTAVMFNTDGTATTWGGTIIVATGDATNFWNEANYRTIPATYTNAGCVVGILRNDDSSDVNSGYWRTLSCTPESSWSAPTKVLSEVHAFVGEPQIVFMPLNAPAGGLFLMTRWQPSTSTLWINLSFTGYGMSWDQGLTWQPMRNYAPGTGSGVLIQYWYASCEQVPSTSNIACAVGLAFNNQTTRAWVQYQEFTVGSP